jgi:hypothetical protein
MSGQTLIELINNPSNWNELCQKELISASGTKANLEDLFSKVSKLASDLRQEM